MPRAYWIAHIDVHDATGFDAYRAANQAAFKKYGARYLVRGGKHEAFGGPARARHVVIEFPNYQAALDCWNSPEYRAAAKLRDGASTGETIVVDGYDGPQPS